MVLNSLFMSTMAVYAGNREEVITEETIPMPVTAYGESKLQAEWLISELEDRDFSVAILRPPMIYGKGCKGNYNALVKIAKISPIFPKINNRRSMLYIGNLCEFIRLLIEDTAGGIFFPQNKEYVNTSDMVKEIGKANQKKVHLMPGGRFLIGGMKYIPGGIGKKSDKAFGNLVFDKAMSIYRNHSGEEVNYQVASFESGIRETENR